MRRSLEFAQQWEDRRITAERCVHDEQQRLKRVGQRLVRCAEERATEDTVFDTSSNLAQAQIKFIL